ncbi:MAG: bifunctional NADH-specific enoyl-ACP reductase/trans-2-enoyl-CoA reductase [Verrucomicrobia bacterium]|nr:MAG: bifunctional NADH-specific enoyl-ACP reductase/trans-2-enoyl-CoA reductase [Verrucomicrobiota bacterium]
MIIRPKVRGFVCVTAHPQGCAAHIQEQIAYVRKEGSVKQGPKRVLVIGASTGYGLSSRIVSAFGSGAATIGVFFERPAGNGRPATGGYYNSVGFEQAAHKEGLYARSINGDAFSDEIKQKVIDLIQEDLGTVDMVVYSLAAPRRNHPKTGAVHKSTIKPIGASFTGKSVDTDEGVISEITIEAATGREIADTIAVMGGEDWEMWIDQLKAGGVLAPDATTVAYDYIGPEMTWPIYTNGTIGAAKRDLRAACSRIQSKIGDDGGRAFISVNKALVSQASSAIPVVPLYISILYKVMKQMGIHEGCIEQIDRLFRTRLFGGVDPHLDNDGRIRIDDFEMRPEVQKAVADIWPEVTTENLAELTDIAGYREEFLKLFGFGLPGIDYEARVDSELSLKE